MGKLVGGKGPDGLAQPTDQIIAVVTDAKYRSLREPGSSYFLSSNGQWCRY